MFLRLLVIPTPCIIAFVTLPAPPSAEEDMTLLQKLTMGTWVHRKIQIIFFITSKKYYLNI